MSGRGRLARAWEQAGLECPADAHVWGEYRDDPLFTSIRYWPRYGVVAVGWDGESWRHVARHTLLDLAVLGAPILSGARLDGPGMKDDLTAEPWYGGEPGRRHGPLEFA